MSSRKIAVVTGSNRGIGYAIVKGLCEKFDGIVYLTSKYEGKGRATVQKLKKLGLNPAYHQLDISDQNSVDAFRDYIKDTYGGLDILINNAAVVYHMGAKESAAVQAEETINVNYFGTLRVCLSLFPLLRDNSRVVNISSYSGKLSKIPSKDLRARFSREDLTISQLNELMKTFIGAARDGNMLEDGWGSSSYAISKVALTALTFIQQTVQCGTALSQCGRQRGPSRLCRHRHGHPQGGPHDRGGRQGSVVPCPRSRSKGPVRLERLLCR